METPTTTRSKKSLKNLTNAQYADKFGLTVEQVEQAQVVLNYILLQAREHPATSTGVLEELTEGRGRDIGKTLAKRIIESYSGVALPNFAKVTAVRGIGETLSARMVRELSRYSLGFLEEFFETGKLIFNPENSDLWDEIEAAWEIHDIQNEEWLLGVPDTVWKPLFLELQLNEFNWEPQDEKEKLLKGKDLVEELKEAILSGANRFSNVVRVLQKADPAERATAFKTAYNSKYDIDPDVSIGPDRFRQFLLDKLGEQFPDVYKAVTNKPAPSLGTDFARFANFTFLPMPQLVELIRNFLEGGIIKISPENAARRLMELLKSSTLSAGKKQVVASAVLQLGEKYAGMKRVANDFLRVRERMLDLMKGDRFGKPASQVAYYEDKPELKDPNDWILRENLSLVGSIGSATIQHPVWGRMAESREVRAAHGASLMVLGFSRPLVFAYLFSDQYYENKKKRVRQDMAKSNLPQKQREEIQRLLKNLNASTAKEKRKAYRKALQTIAKQFTFQQSLAKDRFAIAISAGWKFLVKEYNLPWKRVNGYLIGAMAAFLVLSAVLSGPLLLLLMAVVGTDRALHFAKVIATFIHQCKTANSNLELEAAGKSFAQRLGDQVFFSILFYFSGRAFTRYVKKPWQQRGMNKDQKLVANTKDSISTTARKQLEIMEQDMQTAATANYLRRLQRYGLNVSKVLEANAKLGRRVFYNGRPRLHSTKATLEARAERRALRNRGIRKKDDEGIRASLEHFGREEPHIILGMGIRNLKPGSPKPMIIKAKSCNDLDLYLSRHMRFTASNLTEVVFYNPKLPPLVLRTFLRVFKPKLYQRILARYKRRKYEFENPSEVLPKDKSLYRIIRGRVIDSTTKKVFVSDIDGLLYAFGGKRNLILAEKLTTHMRSLGVDVRHGPLNHWPLLKNFTSENAKKFAEQWQGILTKGEPVVVYEYLKGKITVTICSWSDFIRRLMLLK